MMPFVPDFFQDASFIDNSSLARYRQNEARAPAPAKIRASVPTRMPYTRQSETTTYNEINTKLATPQSSYEARRLRLWSQSNWAGVTTQMRLLSQPKTPEPQTYARDKRQRHVAGHNVYSAVETKQPAKVRRLGKNTCIQIGSKEYDWSSSNYTARTRRETISSPYTTWYRQRITPTRHSPIHSSIYTPRGRSPTSRACYHTYRRPAITSEQHLEEQAPLNVVQSSPVSIHEPAPLAIPQPILPQVDDSLTAHTGVFASPVPSSVSSPVLSPTPTMEIETLNWDDLFDSDALSMVCEADEPELSPSVGHDTQTTWSLRDLATSESEAPTWSRHGGVGEECSTAKPPPGTPRVPHHCISGPAQSAISWNANMAAASLLLPERSGESGKATTNRFVGAEEGRLTDAHLTSTLARDLPVQAEGCSSGSMSTLRLPKPFVGRLAGQHIPYDQALDARPAKGSRSKKQFTDGKINIRSLPNFDGDPIEDFLS